MTTDAPVAWFDMDGTLFDYVATLKADLAKLRSPDEPEIDNPFDSEEPWMEARMKLIKSQPGWWRNLPLMPLGTQLLEIAQDIGFDCEILTKGPRSHPRAWAEKVECIQKHFGPNLTINIVGKTKGRSYARVLVDDFPEYVESWLKHRKRGLAILPAQHYNVDFEHPNAIRYDGTNLAQVRDAMEAAFSRKEGEHWLSNNERTVNL